jgi:hypothetical protein
VTAASGESAITDTTGRFVLTLPAGEIDLVIVAPDHEPLRVRERVASGSSPVEYRLTPTAITRYRSRVRADPHESAHFTLEGEALRTSPGTLGDPLRTLGLMPGVSTPVTLFPIYIVRGDSPGMNGFFLDGMRVPQLFHVLVGGGVIQPSLVERLDFYPGSYDASFGRYAGGIADAETRTARSDGQHLDVQLRAYDLAATAELALPHGVAVTLSGAYGWPGVFINLFRAGTTANYGDYQLRLDWKGLTVQALGSYDSVEVDNAKLGPTVFHDQFRLTFHRVQARWRGKRGPLAYSAAIVGGYDQARNFGGGGVTKLGLGWRINVAARWRRITLSAGTDGELSRFRGTDFDGAGASNNELGELAGDRDGVIFGAYANLRIDIVRQRLFATVGLRSDVYRAAGTTLVGVDPRADLRLVLRPGLEVRAGGGVYHQPPSFPIPLPGLDTFALELGLQTAYQGSVGIDATLPQGFSFSLTGYFQRFHNIEDAALGTDLVLDCASPPPEPLKGVAAQLLRQQDGQAFGAELLLRRKGPVIEGWIAYSLSKSERFLPCGIRPADFDQNHTLNVVVQARLPRRFVLGAHLYVVSGRPLTRVDPTRGPATPPNNDRLPTFVQLDLRLDREWIFRRWRMMLFLEILNVTYSESIFGVDYPTDPMTMMKRFDQPTPSGVSWILPSVGVRGRF